MEKEWLKKGREAPHLSVDAVTSALEDLAGHWKELGWQLVLPGESILNSIEKNNSTEMECLREVVKFFLDRCPLASWRYIIFSLDLMIGDSSYESWHDKLKRVRTKIEPYAEELTDTSLTYDAVLASLKSVKSSDIVGYILVPDTRIKELQRKGTTDRDELVKYYIKTHSRAGWKHLAGRLLLKEEKAALEVVKQKIKISERDPTLTISNLTELLHKVALWDLFHESLRIPNSTYEAIKMQFSDSYERTKALCVWYLDNHPAPSWIDVADGLYNCWEYASLEKVNRDYLKAGSSVPEILQLDERQERSQVNQRVFQRVITAKCVISICVVIFNYLGLPRSGKTTFRRRIMGEILNLVEARLAGETEQPSTGVVEDGGQVFIKPSCMEMGTIKSKVWSVINSLGDEVTMLYQLFYNTLGLPETPSLKNPQILAETSNHGSKDEVNESCHFTESKITSAENSASDVTSYETASTTLPALKANENKDRHQESRHDEDMLNILKDIMETDHWEEVKDLLEDTILVSNNDTGGQAEFLDLQAALIQGPSFNLFFSRLHDDLEKVFQVYYTNERGESSTKEDSTMTTEEAMYQALANIACFDHTLSSERSGSKKKGSQSVNASSKAMFVCTHMDKVNEEMRERVFTEKDKLLQKKIKETEFYEKDIIMYASENQLMLPVDNLNGGEDEIKSIQEILMREIEKSFSNRIDIPASWLILSLYLRKNFSIVTFKKCEEIAKKLGIDLEELQDALWFLHHRVGVILYYPEVEAMRDTVICKMQVVFDSASNLIRNTFTFNKVGQRLMNKFKQKGQFSLSDIKDATAQHTDLIPLEKLVKLFQHLNIIATIRPILDSPSEPTYFMPCVLQSARASELNVPSSNSEDPAPLLLHYDCGYVPVGIFPAMITNLVSQQREDWELIEDGLCKNRVQFHVGEDCDMVTFISRLRYFKIVITRAEKFDRPTESLCAHVRSVFQSTLDKVTSIMNYNMSYRLAFECPAHPGKKHLCTLTKESAKKMFCQENPRRKRAFVLEQRHKMWFSSTTSYHVECSGSALKASQTKDCEQLLPDLDPKGSLIKCYESSLPESAQLFLDNQLDWDHENVDRHLNRIADTMIDWEKNLSTRMALRDVQIHDLKEKHKHSSPVLLRRAVLKKWKEQQGLQATYRNLLKLCCEGGDTRTAETICQVLREKTLEQV